MKNTSQHTFHIPVMGLAFTIDTPVKVARYGISSVISIVDDALTELMRKYYCEQIGEVYDPISEKDDDHRAKRIKSYLNLVNQMVNNQITQLKEEGFSTDSDLTRYFELLPDSSSVKQIYDEMLITSDPVEAAQLQSVLIEEVRAGSIDVNIMTKVDKTNYDKAGNAMPVEFTDAIAALRGFADSDLSSSVIFSAGMNPRLYAYLENLQGFYPDGDGNLKKKVILKVSDYRSALIQGKFLAKKGIWISEFRIESGLNCGGHAFATDGFLLGPILDEFKQNRVQLLDDLNDLYQKALLSKGYEPFEVPEQKITVQGGIGTAEEDQFLMNYYELDGTGWGTPFLLCPEATNVEDYTIQQLANAGENDLYLSGISPLGVPFNSLRGNEADQEREARIKKKKPGSPCVRKFLVSNTEFTDQPICTASTKYQRLKIKELDGLGLSNGEYDKHYREITDKTCLCEGLETAVIKKNGISVNKTNNSTAVCPGPNMAYFTRVYSLSEMAGHIYGRLNIMNITDRPNMFIKELGLYVDYFRNEIIKSLPEMSQKQIKYFDKFKVNMLEGIAYYRDKANVIANNSDATMSQLKQQLSEMEEQLMGLYHTSSESV
ncbi:MAG: hypothetical protein WD267_10895 [Balneolales bacterium]